MEKALNRRRVGSNVGIILIASFVTLMYGRKFSKDRKKQVKDLDEEHFN